MQALRLSDITLDPDLQSRAEIDQDMVRDYAEALAGGAQFDRIKVVLDGATYWLVDGYHRWHAHRQAGVEEIAATVRQGSKQDAILLSLSANAQHGKQRGPGDYKKAYQIAVRHALVGAVDTEGVQSLLQCSIRWARELTKEAREEAEHQKAEAIRAARRQGKTQRQVAAEVGVSKSQVAKVDVAHKRQPSVCGQVELPDSAVTQFPAPAGDNPPRPAPAAVSFDPYEGVEPFDRGAADLRRDLMAAIQTIGDMPNVRAAQDACNKSTGFGTPPASVTAAAVWLTEFAAVYALEEPTRAEAAQQLAGAAA